MILYLPSSINTPHPPYVKKPTNSVKKLQGSKGQFLSEGLRDGPSPGMGPRSRHPQAKMGPKPKKSYVEEIKKLVRGSRKPPKSSEI